MTLREDLYDSIMDAIRSAESGRYERSINPMEATQNVLRVLEEFELIPKGDPQPEAEESGVSEEEYIQGVVDGKYF
jgi:hypothetical protein